MAVTSDDDEDRALRAEQAATGGGPPAPNWSERSVGMPAEFQRPGGARCRAR